MGLLCPADRLGRADLLIVSHHGSRLSTSPQLFAALAPRVALMGKGGGRARVRDDCCRVLAPGAVAAAFRHP